MNLGGKLILLISVFSLMACTRGEGGSDASNSISFDKKADAQKSFESVSIVCGEENLNCPEYIAAVSILIHNPEQAKPWNSQVCSGTLIGHNKILTNDHCLGSGLIKENDSCAGAVKIFFPKTKTKDSEVIECSKIYKMSDRINNDAQRPDWVILELDQSVSRKSANINVHGSETGKKVIGHPINYTKNKISFDGKILKNICTTTTKHYYSTYYFHPHSALVTAALCNLGTLPGTSGTSYFNESNEIQFVGSFTVNVEKDKDYQVIEYYGKNHQLNNKMVGGTNISCIPELNPTPSPFCYFSSTTNFISLINNSRYSYQKNDEHKDKISKLKKRNSQVQWKLTDKNSLYFTQTKNSFNERYNKEPTTTIFEYRTIPSEIIEYLSLNVAQATYPLTPTCLSSNLIFSNETEIPYIEASSYNMNIDGDGLVSFPSDFEFLKIDFSKNESNTFDAELLRMDTSLRGEYLQMEQSLAVALVNCSASGEKTEHEVHPCTTFKDKKRAFDQWMEENNITIDLRRNEIITLLLGEKDFDLTIPACK